MVRVRNKNSSKRLILGLTLLFSAVVPQVVSAQVTSPNYQSNEFFFGTGGDVEVTSPNYKAQGSAGALGVGNVSSTNYQAYSGFLTPNEPFLEMSVNTSIVDLGTLDTATTKTGTASFQVRTYVNSGYTVKTVSQPPQIPSTSATLAPMASQAGSVFGTEQFGINLKANTSPATFGADPSPQPNSTFATGQAATGYETANLYKYSVGDTIAQTGTSGWGLTIFTISYIANIAPLTEAGLYTMVHDLVVIATY